MSYVRNIVKEVPQDIPMKIRIQDNSIRFRLTLREVEVLKEEGFLERTTTVLGPEGPVASLCYAVWHDPDVRESLVEMPPNQIRMTLCNEDFMSLCDDAQEGVYVRREWTAPDGTSERFIAFVEKDRPGSTCIKPENWIYDMEKGVPTELRPIGSRR